MRMAHSQGFTLLELLAVLLLLTLMLGLAVPTLRRGWEGLRIASGLRQMAGALRTARSLAVAQHQRVRVLVDLEQGTYRLEDGSRSGYWPRPLRLLDAHLVWENPGARRGYIAFYGDGSSSGGYLALGDPSGRRHFLSVEVITGKVKLTTGGG